MAERTCLCGAEIPKRIGRHGRPPKLCNDCRTQLHLRKDGKPKGSGDQEWICQKCGVSWTRPAARGQVPKWCPDCSPHHRKRKSRQTPPTTWTCDQCGKALKPGGTIGRAADGKVLCKQHRAQERDKQRIIQNRRRRAEQKLTTAARGTRGRTLWVNRTCRCGTRFITQSNNPGISCSSTCATANKIDKMKAANQRRRAAKKNAFVAKVSPARVFKLDGYRCYICNRKTKPNANPQHPRYPTIDHIIPLAKGGTHEPSNCRTACRQCNSNKREHGGWEQFALPI